MRPDSRIAFFVFALTTTYTYIPLVGIESVTAPNGEKTSYLYDGEGRLTEEYLLDGPHRLL